MSWSLYIIQYIAFLQNLIDGASVRTVKGRPAWMYSVVHPVGVPAGGGPDKFLNKTVNVVQLFNFQATVDTDVDRWFRW